MRSNSKKKTGYSDLSLDTAIFHNRKLTFSQALVLYLREDQRCSLTTIAELLNRDSRTIWTQYSTAIQKIGTRFYRFAPTKTEIPLSCLRGRDTSILEAAVLYLKSQGMRNREIAAALGRNAKTISSLLTRIAKRGESQ